MSRKVLITGGAGYVGSHACKAFSEAGWTVVVFDNLSRGWRDFVKWGELIEGDLSDKIKIDETIKFVKPHLVVHFAAFAYVGESVANPAIYYRNNVVGTLNLLDAMIENGVSQFIFSSTCATYGQPEKLPITENTQQNPLNPYGRSKLTVEGIIRDYQAAYNFRSVILRYFNAAGADPELQIGERHQPETHLIPLTIQGIGVEDGNSSFQLKVFGDDFNTRDGSCIRDYVHVSDLAQAHLQSAEYLAAGNKSNVFNLGTGHGTSVLEIISAVETVTGRKVNFEIVDRRDGDPAKLVASAEKAKETLGWEPTHSKIENIIRTAYDWHRLERQSQEV